MKARDVRVFFSDRTVIAYSMVDVLCFQTRLSYKYSEPRKLSHMEGGNKVDWILLALLPQEGSSPLYFPAVIVQKSGLIIVGPSFLFTFYLAVRTLYVLGQI